MATEYHRTQSSTETTVSHISDFPPISELLDEVDITKSTIYDYVDALQNGGLLITVGEKEGSTAYTANEFTFTFEIDTAEVHITPELVEVLSHQDDAPEIQAFVDRYGVVTLAEFIDLAYEQAQGDVTTRMIAEILDISRGSAYDTLEQVHRLLDIGDGDPETLHADELTATEREELRDRSPPN